MFDFEQEPSVERCLNTVDLFTGETDRPVKKDISKMDRIKCKKCGSRHYVNAPCNGTTSETDSKDNSLLYQKTNDESGNLKPRFAMIELPFMARLARTKGINQTHFLIVTVLIAYTNGASGRAFPSMATISKIVNRRPETVRKAIQDLDRWGFIERNYIHRMGNEYRVKQ